MGNKLKLAANSQAMMKLDTLIEKDDPYADEPGGPTYLASKRKSSTIVDMYSTNTDKKADIKKKILVGGLIILLGVTLVTIIVVAILV